MSALWKSESGILRKNDEKPKIEDLLVFGYACKLFRDDEKAKEIDQGKHLIPWMGDNTLKIDRYDGRGALSDLTPYEASKEGYDAMRWLGLSDADHKIEQLCDEERYYALYNNVEEEDIYKEEELKRAQNQGQVQFNYDASSESKESDEIKNDETENEELYTPRPELDIPVNMTLPKTVKENARIEKTALFISKEGPQMEILVKTKQSNNPQFSFMNQDDPLYRYYRHVLMAIKTGRYRVLTEAQKIDQMDDKKLESDHYLHPSLAATEQPDSVPQMTPIPSIFYKPSANCAYSQLVNRIQGNQNLADQNPVQNIPPTPAQFPEVQNGGPNQAYAQHYQQYGYYPNFDPNNPYYGQAYAQNPQAYEQYKQFYEQNPSGNPYAQIVSNVKGAKEIQEPQLENGAQVIENYAPNTEITKAPIIYSQEPQVATHIPNQPQIIQNVAPNPQSRIQIHAIVGINQPPINVNQPPIPQNSVPIVQNQLQLPQNPALPSENPPNPLSLVPKVDKPKKTHNLFSLAEYSGSESDSETENESQSDTQAIVIPPNETQVIIDKMASYVAKNGTDFENIVKSKGDPRFVFLDSTHVFYPYYKYKLKEFGGGENEKKDQETGVKKIAEKENLNREKTAESKVEERGENKAGSKAKEKKIITPVCFSIKKAKDEPVASNKSALPVEDSSDDESEKVAVDQTSTNSTNNCSANSQNDEKRLHTSQESNTQNNHSNTDSLKSATDDSSNKNSENSNNKLSASQIIEIEDPIMELIDLTDDLEDRRDAKRAEDRLKDKIALAAREKLAVKNKALQLERKKRAAAFLSQLKPTTKSKTETESKSNPRSSSPPEEGEINGDTPPLNNLPDDPLKVYHIDPKISPKPSEKHSVEGSRSPKHKSSHHKKKSHKRSHSHSRKRKREKRSHEKKKSKRKKRSRSRERDRSRSRSRSSRHKSKSHDSKREKIDSSSSSESDD